MTAVEGGVGRASLDYQGPGLQLLVMTCEVCGAVVTPGTVGKHREWHEREHA